MEPLDITHRWFSKNLFVSSAKVFLAHYTGILGDSLAEELRGGFDLFLTPSSFANFFFREVV